MRRLTPTKIDNAKYYEEVWGNIARPWYDATRQRQLYRHIKDGDKLIDLGAGVFGTAQYIAENTDLRVHLVAADQSYTARDAVLKMLTTTSRQKYLSFTYVETQIPTVPYPDHQFDIVVAGELIEHYEDPSDLVKEMARLCKHGGKMSISTVNPHCENAKGKKYPEHIWDFEPSDLLQLFAPYSTPVYYVFGDYHFVEAVRL